MNFFQSIRLVWYFLEEVKVGNFGRITKFKARAFKPSNNTLTCLSQSGSRFVRFFYNIDVDFLLISMTLKICFGQHFLYLWHWSTEVGVVKLYLHWFSDIGLCKIREKLVILTNRNSHDSSQDFGFGEHSIVDEKGVLYAEIKERNYSKKSQRYQQPMKTKRDQKGLP